MARLSYIKVVEFQRRGLVHLHVVSGPTAAAGPTEPPPAWLDAARAHAALERPWSPASASPCRASAGAALRRARWGAQHDVRVLVAGERRRRHGHRRLRGQVRHQDGGRDGRGWPIGSARAQLERLELRPHVVAMVRTAWTLGRPQGTRRTCACATTPTPSATPGSSPPRACASRPPSGRCARPGPTTSDGERDDDFDYDGEWRYAGRGYANPEADDPGRVAPRGRLESRRVPKGSQTTSQKGSQTP